jgi:methanogenic corrinoid protein MtbC1
MRDRVKIMVGGAPVTDEFVKKIGGDGYASNAGAAVDKAKELLGR